VKSLQFKICRVCGLGVVFLFVVEGLRAQTLNVTNFGARGDAAPILAKTTAGSSVITVLKNNFSSRDVGKLILLFGAGPATTPTKHQDFLGRIVSVTDGSLLTVFPSVGASGVNMTGFVGTQNALAFQNCVDAASGSNTIIQIPAGQYLLVPSNLLNSNFVMKNASITSAAVVLQKGGLHFLGAGPEQTTLLACGAWQLKTNHASRGQLFACKGPVTNDAPLIFEGMTMDGGVFTGRQDVNGKTSFPASSTDGSGWDITHHAVMDCGVPPLHGYKLFTNCRFVHWRGEILTSVVPLVDGFVAVTNCDFVDGEASAFNFSFSHRISDCRFSNLDMAMEFYQGYTTKPSVFENSIVTNVWGDLVLVGAETNHTMPPYAVRNNLLEARSYSILVCPARNLIVSGNCFRNANMGIGSGPGYQGTECNGNLLVSNNVFTNVYYPILIQDTGRNRMESMTVCDNAAIHGQAFGYGWGWSTNVSFVRNSVADFKLGLASSQLRGQWFADDLSNQFPPVKSYGVSGTSGTITYANGARQEIWVGITNYGFFLDDSQPRKIPPQAVLHITSTGKYDAWVCPSTTRTNLPPKTLAAGHSLMLAWTNQSWQTVAN